MARLNSRLEAEGAEFLTLGRLLIEGIVAHKTYMHIAGYDLIASNPTRGTSRRIQVKSRWATNYGGGFPIKNLDCDFVVFVALNRGYRSKSPRKSSGTGKAPPKFYVFPIGVLRDVPRTKGWGKLNLRNVKEPESYVDRWDLIATSLEKHT